MQLPVNLQVPMGTILGLSAEMDIENELTLVNMAAMLNLVAEQSAYLPDGAFVDAIYCALEAFFSGDLEEMADGLDKLVQLSKRVDFRSFTSPNESDDPVFVPFHTEVPLEAVLRRSDWDPSDDVQETLRAVALRELTIDLSAYVRAVGQRHPSWFSSAVRLRRPDIL